MRQFMQACLFAFANAAAVVGADLDPALSASAWLRPRPPATVTGPACDENAVSKVHPLDGEDVSRTMTIINSHRPRSAPLRPAR